LFSHAVKIKRKAMRERISFFIEKKV